MSIIVTGASGQLGRLVAEQLLDAGHTPVLISRDPAKLSDLAERGAQARRGDFDDPASLPAAFAGGEKLLLISTDQVGNRLAGHLAAIDAAAAAGVRHVAYTSVTNPSDSNPIAVASDHRETEDALRASGLKWTFLRNNIYTEMLVGNAQAAIASGRHVTNNGEGRTAHVSRDDCAAAAVAVLTQDGHEDKVYDVTGPEALSPADLAALFAELGGTPVDVVPVDDAAFEAGLIEQAGLPQEAAGVVASFGRGARLGFMAPVSSTVSDLTARPPRSVREVLEPLLTAS